MQVKNVTRTGRKVLDLGMMDVVDANGVLLEDVPCKAVMVTSQTDLANLPDYPAGTIAFTAGFVNMWQKDASGNWAEF